MSFMRTSTTVVDARAYSFASGETSEEIEIGTSPSTCSASARRRCSCCGLTYALMRQIATPWTSQRFTTSSCARAWSSSSGVSTEPSASRRSAMPRRR